MFVGCLRAVCCCLPACLPPACTTRAPLPPPHHTLAPPPLADARHLPLAELARATSDKTAFVLPAFMTVRDGAMDDEIAKAAVRGERGTAGWGGWLVRVCVALLGRCAAALAAAPPPPPTPTHRLPRSLCVHAAGKPALVDYVQQGMLMPFEGGWLWGWVVRVGGCVFARARVWVCLHWRARGPHPPTHPRRHLHARVHRGPPRHQLYAMAVLPGGRRRAVRVKVRPRV